MIAKRGPRIVSTIALENIGYSGLGNGNRDDPNNEKGIKISTKIGKGVTLKSLQLLYSIQINGNRHMAITNLTPVIKVPKTL